MALKSFNDFLKLKDGEPVSPYTSEVPPIQSADSDGDEIGPGDLGSTGMGHKLSPLEPVKDRAQPLYNKTGRLKFQKESVQAETVINEERNQDDFHMKSVDGTKFSPPVHEVSRYVAEMIKRFPHTADKLLRETKRQGSFNHLVERSLDHPEFFDEVSKHFSHSENGPKHVRKFVKSMHNSHNLAKEHFGAFGESVDAPRGDSGLGSSMSPLSQPSGPFAMGQPSPVAGGGMTEPSNMGMGLGNSMNGSTSPPPALNLPPTATTESKAKTAHHFMIDEMAKCEPMSDYMRECMMPY